MIDQERILIGAVGSASVLDDSQTARGNLFRYPMVQRDHAIGNIFLQPVARQRVLSRFAGNDSSKPVFFQPLKQPAKFRSQCR